MTAFALAELFEVTDPDRMAAYGKATGATLAAHGGKVIAANPGRAVEGDWAPNRLVILQFENMEALEGWYNSPEYQEILPMRLEASNGDLVMVEGM